MDRTKETIMRFQHFTPILMICASALMAGCPSESDLGLVSGYDDSYYEVIPDGNYAGYVNGIFESWYWGELYQQASGGDQSGATFSNGVVLKDSGQALRIGDIEDMDFGAFTASRQVYDVEVDDYFYEVSFDVWAQWDSVPMAGTEFISFSENSDGSITMFDSLELISLDEYDGGAWTFHVNSSGTLYPFDGSENPPDNLSNPILDLKSGKSIVYDMASR